MRIANRAANPNLPSYSWTMQVTQIECQEKATNARYNVLRAPNGCLQYFTASTGSIESFNYNNRAGPYLGNMDYGICFQRLLQNSRLT